MFSKGILELTWWPLFRDCSFYVVSIILLMVFFTTGNKIEWWEALLLLMYYVSYVVFMKFNQRIEAWVKVSNYKVLFLLPIYRKNSIEKATKSVQPTQKSPCLALKEVS